MKRWLSMTSAAAILLALATQLPHSYADDDEDDYRGGTLAPVRNVLYQEECGSCHFAYPPGLLPAASWRLILGTLEDHYGDNAELDTDTVASLLQYLTDNAADVRRHRRSRQIMQAARDGAVPLRITEIPFMRHEHREIARWLKRQRSGIALSQCDQCHRRAAAGSFREREIDIPGFGRWDD